MAILTLPSPGQPRPSGFEALAGGVASAGESIGQGFKQRALLNQEQAKLDRTETNKNRDFTYKVVRDLSFTVNAMTKPAERKNFIESDQYKQIQKLVKKNLPEFVDANGNIIILSNDDLVAEDLKGLKGYLEDVNSSGKANEREQTLFAGITKWGEQTMAKILNSMKGVDPVQVFDNIKRMLSKGGQNKFQEGLANDPLGARS